MDSDRDTCISYVLLFPEDLDVVGFSLLRFTILTIAEDWFKMYTKLKSKTCQYLIYKSGVLEFLVE